MIFDIDTLKLIKLVNDNKRGSKELETLAKLVDEKHQIIIKTTLNEHYNYKFYNEDVDGHLFKDRDNHVDVMLKFLSKDSFDEMEKSNYKEKYHNLLEINK